MRMLGYAIFFLIAVFYCACSEVSNFVRDSKAIWTLKEIKYEPTNCEFLGEVKGVYRTSTINESAKSNATSNMKGRAMDLGADTVYITGGNPIFDGSRFKGYYMDGKAYKCDKSQEKKE